MYSQNLIDSVSNEKNALSSKIDNAKSAILKAQEELARLLEAEKLLNTILAHQDGKNSRVAIPKKTNGENTTPIKDKCFLIMSDHGAEMKLADILMRLKEAGNGYSLNGVRAAIKSLILCKRVEKVNHGRYKVCDEIAA